MTVLSGDIELLPYVKDLLPEDHEIVSPAEIKVGDLLSGVWWKEPVLHGTGGQERFAMFAPVNPWRITAVKVTKDFMSRDSYVFSIESVAEGVTHTLPISAKQRLITPKKS